MSTQQTSNSQYQLDNVPPDAVGILYESKLKTCLGQFVSAFEMLNQRFERQFPLNRKHMQSVQTIQY